MSDGLFLHRGVHDHALELGVLDGLDFDRSLDGGLDQLLQAVFADGTAKAADLRGVARQPRLVVLHAAEELPHNVLAPARNELFVAQVERILQAQQSGHEPHRQARTAGVAQTGAELHGVFAEQIAGNHLL